MNPSFNYVYIYITYIDFNRQLISYIGDYSINSNTINCDNIISIENITNKTINLSTPVSSISNNIIFSNGDSTFTENQISTTFEIQSIKSNFRKEKCCCQIVEKAE